MSEENNNNNNKRTDVPSFLDQMLSKDSSKHYEEINDLLNKYDKIAVRDTQGNMAGYIKKNKEGKLSFEEYQQFTNGNKENNNKIDLSNMTYEKLVSLLKENGGKIVLETKKGSHEIKLGKDGKTIDLGDMKNLVEENKSLEVTENDLKDFEDFDVYEEVNIFDDDDSDEKGEEKPSSYSAIFNKEASLDDIKNNKIKLDVTPIYKNKYGLEQGKTKTIEFDISDGWLKKKDENDKDKFVYCDMSGNTLGSSEDGKPPKGAIEARRHPAIISAFSRPEHGLGPENIPGIDENAFKTFGKDLVDGIKESRAAFKRADGFWNTTGAILYSGFVRPSKYIFRKGVNAVGKGVNYIGNIKVESGTKTLSQKISESKFGQGFEKYVGLPLKKAYKNVFDNRNSETITGTIGSVANSTIDFVEGTVSRIGNAITGTAEKTPENIGIDKSKINYLVEADQKNKLNDIKNGKISLNVQAYYKDMDSGQIVALNPEKINFDISDGYLKKAGKDGKAVYCDINGNEVDEKNKVEACRELHVIDIFCRSGEGLGPENIPRPKGEFFLKTFGKDVWGEIKGAGRDLSNAKGFTGKAGSVLHTMFIRPVKFVGRKLVNGACKFCEVTGISEKKWAEDLVKSDFGQGVKASYKALFDNPRNNSITGTVKAVAFSFVGRPVRYGYRKLIKPRVIEVRDAISRFFKGRYPKKPDESENKLGNDKKNRPKYEIKLLKKPKEIENGDMKIVVRVSEFKRDNLTGEWVQSGFEDRILSISKENGFLKNKKDELCDFKGDKVDKGIEACRDSHILKAFTMSGNGIGPENIPKYVDNNNLYVLKDMWDGAKGLGRQVKEAKMFGKKIPVIGHIYNTVAITWRAPLKITKYTVRGIVNAGYKIAEKSGLLDSQIIKNFAQTDFAKGMKANYKNIFDNYQKDTTWETTKAVAFSVIGRPVRYVWRSIKTPVKQELKASYQQFKNADGFWRKTNVVLGYPIKFIVKCPIKISVKVVGKVFGGIGWAAKGIDSLTGKKLGGFFKEKIVDTKFGRVVKAIGNGIKKTYKAIIDTPENDTFIGTLISPFYAPVKSGIDAYKEYKENEDKIKNDIGEKKENLNDDSKGENLKDDGQKEGKIELGDSRNEENIKKEVDKILEGVDLNQIESFVISSTDGKTPIDMTTEAKSLNSGALKKKIESNLSKGSNISLETKDGKKIDLIPKQDIESGQKFSLEYKITNKETKTIDNKNDIKKSLIEESKEDKKVSDIMAGDKVRQNENQEEKKKEEKNKQDM